MSAPTDGRHADVIVIGAGIAGAGVAAHLAEHMRVTVVEREPLAGMHATGRSAALYSGVYGNAVVRALSRASRAFLLDPPAQFIDDALTRPRGAMFFADESSLDALEAFAAEPDIRAAMRRLTRAEALERCGILKRSAVAAALIEEDAHDVDVGRLHQGYLRLVRARGGCVATDREVRAIRRDGRRWRVLAGSDWLSAEVLVNAAGAWADAVGALAGAVSIGLQPMRRTAILVEAPKAPGAADWPLVLDIDETFYFKPESGYLLLSPADETPSPPCDAQPEELDIAVAIDRVQQVADVDPVRIVRTWAGLRSFVADRSPVAGYDPQAENFFWLAGQGGYGIQTAPALSRAAAALVRRMPLPADIAAFGVAETALSPARLVHPALAIADVR
jgi:D-arginine dehydrogenase